MQKFDYESECDRYCEQLFDYVSDILTEDERAAIELHIGSCQRCAKELEEIRAILGAAAALAEPEVPDGLRTAVSERLLREERATNLKKRRFMRAAQIAVPIAACAALAIGIYSGGLYDRYMNAYDMVTTGITENSAQNDDTELADTDEVILQEDEGIDVGTNAPVQSRPQPSPDSKPENENIKREVTEVEEAIPDESDDASIPESVTEETASESYAVQTAEEPEAGVPMEASVEEEDVQQFSIRRMRNDAAITEAAEEEPVEVDEATDSTAMSYTASGAASGGGGSAAAEAKRTDAPPARCTITTDDAAAFAAGFGKVLTDGTFTLSEGEWNAFIEYVRGSGAHLDADYSGEYNGLTTVTVKN